MKISLGFTKLLFAGGQTDRQTDRRRYVEADRHGFASFRHEGCSKPESVVRSGKL